MFWKAMNPKRLHALYNAYFQPVKRRTNDISGHRKTTSYVDFDHPQVESRSLAEYVRGG